jgi:hypothetical protein
VSSDEAETEIPQVAACGPPDPPPIPQLPAAGTKRERTLRRYLTRIVDKLGAPAALLLAAEID